MRLQLSVYQRVLKLVIVASYNHFGIPVGLNNKTPLLQLSHVERAVHDNIVMVRIAFFTRHRVSDEHLCPFLSFTVPEACFHKC